MHVVRDTKAGPSIALAAQQAKEACTSSDQNWVVWWLSPVANTLYTMMMAMKWLKSVWQPRHTAECCCRAGRPSQR